MLITSSWGLGEAVVSSHVTPDTFIISKDEPMRIVSKSVATKLTMHVTIPGGRLVQTFV